MTERHATRRGFTFVEVLFAIIILGVGTIMLAGMLPVAIKQSSDTRNDITGRSVAEAGYAFVRVVAASAMYSLPQTTNTGTNGIVLPAGNGLNPSPGQMLPLSHDLVALNDGLAPTPADNRLADFVSIEGSRVLTSDPRFQWMAFFGRNVGSGTAKLVVVSMRLANTEVAPAYGPATLANEAINANNGPFLVTAAVREGGALESDTIRIPFATVGSVSLTAADSGPIDTGAFAIVASHPVVGADTQRPYRNNGRVFRLGARRYDLEETETGGLIYDLQPGFDLPPFGPGPDGRPNTTDDEPDGSLDPNGSINVGSSVGGSAAQFWFIGRGLQNPTAPYSAGSNRYTGPVQDISVLSVNVPLSQ